MSYINEALKKAQKDKDAGRIGYMHSIAKPGITERSFDIKYIFLILIIILLLAFLIYSRKGEHASHSNENTGNTSLNVPVTEKQYVRNDIPVIDDKNSQKEGILYQDNNEQKNISQREILYKRAVSFFEENKIGAAKAIYKEILIQDPGHINSLNDMGVLLLHEGRYEEAISYLEKAVKLKPKFVNPLYNLACAYSLKNEGEKGMDYLLKAIEIDEKIRDWARQDPDLQNLREYSEFTQITD